jgi:hypothetical protein
VAGYLYFVDQGMRLRSSACGYSSWRMNDPYLARGVFLAGAVVVFLGDPGGVLLVQTEIYRPVNQRSSIFSFFLCTSLNGCNLRVANGWNRKLWPLVRYVILFSL